MRDFVEDDYITKIIVVFKLFSGGMFEMSKICNSRTQKDAMNVIEELLLEGIPLFSVETQYLK